MFLALIRTLADICPDCATSPHDSNHLFNCPNTTTLTFVNLWTFPNRRKWQYFLTWRWKTQQMTNVDWFLKKVKNVGSLLVRYTGLGLLLLQCVILWPMFVLLIAILVLLIAKCWVYCSFSWKDFQESWASFVIYSSWPQLWSQICYN